jgi:hypothetical protein
MGLTQLDEKDAIPKEEKAISPIMQQAEENWISAIT